MEQTTSGLGTSDFVAAMRISGFHVGWVQSIEGGHATAIVVTERVGTNHVAHKPSAGEAVVSPEEV
jgi:hypothetical protein